jgi:16S rRNA (guanine527-N7)-methyltransferase
MPMQPTDELMAAATVFRYFNGLSAKEKAQFISLGPIYREWNARLNLISRKDIDYLYLKHVLHALSIAKVVTLAPGAQVLDVGTGGGFPGIPLAIMFPQTQFHLIDGVGKKIRAVEQIAEALALTNVTASQIRAEHVAGQYDFVLGKAVTDLATFYSWVEGKIAPHSQHNIPNGVLYLKGEATTPLPMPTTQHHTYSIGTFFEDPFFESKQVVHLW